MGRFIMAVITGFVLWTVLWLAAGQIVLAVNPEATGEDGQIVPTTGLFVLFILVAALACIVSGWLAAVIGRDRGARATMVLALVLLAVGLAVEIFSWSMAPVWYHLVFLGLLVPATVLGGSLKR